MRHLLCCTVRFKLKSITSNFLSSKDKRFWRPACSPYARYLEIKKSSTNNNNSKVSFRYFPDKRSGEILTAFGNVGWASPPSRCEKKNHLKKVTKKIEI